jgi:hypothetical protein
VSRIGAFSSPGGRAWERTVFSLRAPGNLSWPLGERPLVIGRGPGSGLLLDDEAVSGRHAAIWADADAVYVQDLGSRNGTLLDGQPVVGTVQAPPGAELCIGRTSLRVECARAAMAPARPLVLEDLDQGHGVAFVGARLRLGTHPDADLRIEGVGDVVVLRGPDDELLLGMDDDTQPLALGEPFAVGGHRFAVQRASAAVQATADLGPPPVVGLWATLEGGPGPLARVRDPRVGAEVGIAAETRATLLWLLGRKLLDDREAGVDEARAGWLAEGDALTGVWGRGSGGTPANLRVLVCRVRKDLREGGVDPWLLEHRAGHLRARLGSVELA